MDRQKEISFIETELNVQIPNSYKKFLLSKGSDVAFGLPILGLPATYDYSSTLGVTSILRTVRPDCNKYLALRTIGERLLCLDLENGSKEDAPLVEINMSESEQPIEVHKSFKQYIEESEKSKTAIKEGLSRVKQLFDKNKKLKNYSHDDEAKRIPFKARDWKIVRQCVHDFITGLLAFRHNERINGIEVEVFLTSDHLDYEQGHGLKAALVLLFSEAHKNGSSLCLKFLNNSIPHSILRFCEKASVSLTQKNTGIVTHEESISIFSYLMGVDSNLISELKRISTDESFSLQGICYLVACKIWDVEQIKWVLFNSPKPLDTLFGKIQPEDFYQFDISISYARALISVDFLSRKLQNYQSKEGETKIESHKSLLKITPYQFSILDWGMQSQNFEINAGEPIYVLPRPRYFIPNLIELLKVDLETLIENAPVNSRRFILYPMELSKFPMFDLLLTRLLKSLNIIGEIGILFLPYSMNELDELVFSKFKKVKSIRK